MRIPFKILFILLPLALAAILGSGQDWNAYAEAWLRGEPYYFSGEPFYSNAEPYFQEIASGFAEPFFYPEINYSQSLYYPYFGEEFFRSGYNPYEAGQRAIEAHRQMFENPYYDFFGESFFAKGEPYPYYQGLKTIPETAQIIPLQPYAILPSYSELRQKSLAGKSWPIHGNLNLTLGYARNRSSFRVYSGGSWS